MQYLLLGFPEGSVTISSTLRIVKKDGVIFYLVCDDNYFSHREDDHASYRFIIASLMENRHVRPCEISKSPLNIPLRTLMHWSSIFREKGSAGFYRSRRPQSHCRAITPEIAILCGQLLDKGYRPAEVARETGIHADTLRKAIKRGAIPRFFGEWCGIIELASDRAFHKRRESGLCNVRSFENLGQPI